MATNIDLYRGTSLLLALNSGVYNLLRFDPGVPEQRDERVASVYQHGEEILYVRHKNAIATAQVMILDDTVANVDAAAEAISEVLSDILASRGTAGEKYYIRAQLINSSRLVQSEVLAARMVQSDNRAAENAEQASKYGSTDSYFRKVTIIFERSWCWEAVTLSELSLSNGHGSGTGGIEVRNSNDSSNDNYAQITGSAILGTERTPLKVYVQRDILGSTDRVRKVHISRNGRFSPNSATTVIEIENATAHYGNYSTDTDTKYSNGSAIQWSPMSTTYDFNMMYGSITNTISQYFRGRWFHILLTAENLSTNDIARVRFVLLLGTVELSTTAWYDIDCNGVHDIGAIKIPPTYLGSLQHMTLTWQIRGYDPNNSSTAVTLDCIHIMPSEPEDGYMIGEAWGDYLGNLSGYIFDGDEKKTYGFLSPTPLYMDYITKTGRYIEVVPGDDCRLLFVWDTYSNTGAKLFASADETYNVQVWYRPRYLHL